MLCSNYLKVCKFVFWGTCRPAVLCVKDIWCHIPRWEAGCLVMAPLNVSMLVHHVWSPFTEILEILVFYLNTWINLDLSTFMEEILHFLYGRKPLAMIWQANCSSFALPPPSFRAITWAAISAIFFPFATPSSSCPPVILANGITPSAPSFLPLSSCPVLFCSDRLKSLPFPHISVCNSTPKTQPKRQF